MHTNYKEAHYTGLNPENELGLRSMEKTDIRSAAETIDRFRREAIFSSKAAINVYGCDVSPEKR